MRVLLSGGSKTQNIVTGIKKKFEYSGDEFVVIEFLDDIKSMFVKGDDFDKAIITEQSITREYTITDENEIRSRINEFATYMREKGNKYTYIFLTQKEEMAELISDEIYSISNVSAVVLKKPPYAVTFFTSIIVTDINQLPSDIVYTPPMIIPNDIGNTDESEENEDFSDLDILDDYVSTDAPDDFDNELFGETNFDLDNDTQIGGGFNINGGEGIGDFDNDSSDEENNFEGFEGFEGFDNTGEEPLELPDDFGEDFTAEDGFDNTEETDFDDFEGSKEFEGFDNTEETDFDDFNGTEEGNFDDFNGFDNAEENNFEGTESFEGFDNIDGFSNTEEGNFDGFDNTVENSFEDTNSFDDLDNTDVKFNSFDENIDMIDMQPIEQSADLPDYSYTKENTEQSNFEEVPLNNDFIPGFDDEEEYTNTEDTLGDSEMYENKDDSFIENEYNNNTDMFDTTDYGEEDEPEQPQYTNEEPEDLGGFVSSDYVDEPQVMNSEPVQPQLEPVQQKKKGLMGRLLGKNKNTPPTNMNVPVNNQTNEVKQNKVQSRNRINPDQVRQSLRPFAARGNSIVVTGCGGCGTSTVAYNIANIINQLGFTVLLVDMDTKGKTQSYISRANYESMEPEGSNLMSAVNSSTGINKHISIVKNGFHLLTMGLGTDKASVNELLHKDKLSRFSNLAKSDTDFVIYDIPFEDATNFLGDITYMTDNLVLVTDASNWGITKTLLSVCNIGSDDMEAMIFNRAQLVFNRYRNLSKVMGKRVKSCNDITKVMDQKVLELLGDDPGFHFKDFHIAGIINDDPDFENGWFDDVQYSDTKKGQDIFLDLVERIVLKK